MFLQNIAFFFFFQAEAGIRVRSPSRGPGDVYKSQKWTRFAGGRLPYSVSIPYGILEVEKDSIKALSEKPTYNYYANAGIYLIKKQMLSLIPDNEYFDATDLIELLIAHGSKVIRFPITGYWIDIGKNEDYNKANELVRHINSD